MADPALLARLAQHRALGSAPEGERGWLADHGTLKAFAAGDVITRKGERATSLWVVLTGHLVIRVDRGAGSHKIFEWRAGDVGGAMPYSRGASPPNDTVAEEPTEVLQVPAEMFPELIRECPSVTATLVHAMIDRARQFTSSDLRDEKLLSLGRLAAGLAHELNNPASAAIRSAKRLTESIAAAEAAARRLGAAGLSEAQLAAIDAVRDLCRAPSGPAAHSPMARADREDAIGAWLAAHGANEGCAVPLAETSLTLAALDRLAASVGADALDASLRWISSGCVVRALASDIETSATRIHELVNAVKGFTFMDHAPTPEPVDIRSGITDTLTMLGAKMREKSVEVSVQIAADLPRAYAVGAELNQVWMNLIDNALDAVATGGHVAVTASLERGRLVVRVIDDGPGIPSAIQGRIFEPFFTTKGVAKGTGLGLDIVRRLVQRHDGALELDSRPGRTEFRISLPTESGLPSTP
jgi:signal transduction histidine kinase